MLIIREKQNLEFQNYIPNEMELKLLLQTMGKRLRYWVIFFSSVFTIENDDDETLLENKQYDKHSNNDNFILTEVNKLLKELNTTKSPGPDQVHPKVLYELTDNIDKPLCTIFNSSFKTGTVPEGWRIGQEVRTLHQTTDQLVLLASYVS